MKIYIGPYNSYNFRLIKFQEWLENKLDLKGDDLEIIFKPYRNIIDKFPTFKRKKKIIIHDYDVWNMDQTLALIIYPMLIKLKENSHGSPNVDDKDVPDYLKSNVNNNCDNSKIHEKWEYVLNKMIKTFLFLKEDEEELFEIEKKLNPNLTFFEYTNKKNKECEEGLRLFAKYYRNLWD